MIKNKRIIAALCALSLATSLSASVSAETIGYSESTSKGSNGGSTGSGSSGFVYGQTDEGTVTTPDGKTVAVSIGNTTGATEKQKKIYENFANYVDSYIGRGLSKKEAELIKADAAKSIIKGGDPTDGEYKIDDISQKSDAQLTIKSIISGYDPSNTYVTIGEQKNEIEEVLVNTSGGSGSVTKQEVSVTVANHLKIQSTDQNGTLLDALFVGQTTDSVQTAINSNTLDQKSKNLLQQVAGTGSSINGVIYGTETMNQFCKTRGLSYEQAINYIIALGNMEPEEVPARDREIASAVRNVFEITDGNAHKEIVKNMDAAIAKSNAELAAAQDYLRSLVGTEIEGKTVVIVVDKEAGTGYIDETTGEFIAMKTIGTGTRYIEGTTYTYINYFNKDSYDGEKLMQSLKIMFPGYDISMEYQSFFRSPPPYTEEFGDQVTKIIQDIYDDYYNNGGGKDEFNKIPLHGDCFPESFLITTDNVGHITSETITGVAASTEIHRYVETMVFELRRFDGLEIADEERARTDADIFVSLYNMYFTPEVRAQDPDGDSMFSILDTYMQLHAQVYGTVGMPPVTTEYKTDKVVYTIDFKTGIEKMAAKIGISYEDFVRNFFSYYVLPTADEWRLDPSQHTYSFYPQETTTNYIPSLTQVNQKTGAIEPYYIGTVHAKTGIRDDIVLNNLFANTSGGLLRVIGNTGMNEKINDEYLKTDSIRPLLLTLRPELSSVFNVHAYVTGSYFVDSPAWKSASTIYSSDGATWYYYPYREVFHPTGGQFFSGSSYSEPWESLRSQAEAKLEASKPVVNPEDPSAMFGPPPEEQKVERNYAEETSAIEKQTKICINSGAAALAQSIIEENNKQFTTGRGDIASYYNYIIYNGMHTSSMEGAISKGYDEWINYPIGEDYYAETITVEGKPILQIPKASNGVPLYTISYGVTKCQYGGSGSSAEFFNQQANANAATSAYNNIMNSWSGDPQELVNSMNDGFGMNVKLNSDGYIETPDGGVASPEVYFQNQMITGELAGAYQEKNGSSSSTSSSDVKKRLHGEEGDPWPDDCLYYPECCTRYFVARWNTNAEVPAVVMDDISPINGADLLAEPYEAERTPQNTVRRDDSVFHCRWSQTLEADPITTTTSFTTTTGTIPTIQTTPVPPPVPPRPDPDPGEDPDPDPDPDPVTTTPTPPIPTPITIPYDDPDKPKPTIEQFISK